MTCRCIRHTELPHTSKLFADFIYDFDRVRKFYPYPPYAAESFAAAAGAIRMDPRRRAQLVEALAEENQNAGEAVLNNLDRLSRLDTLAVATGQQAGLYTGPIYTIYKALTAVRLAADLTERGTPAVPIFWLATEDHDLAEVNHSWVFDVSGQPVRLQASATAQPNQPVGTIRLTGNDGGKLREALAALPFGGEVAELALEAYADGVTFAEGFKRLLARLLSRYGVLLLDPQSPALRRLAAPVIARAIREAPDLTAALLERGKDLETAGYHAQVHMEEKTSLFFLIENGTRTHLTRSSQGYTENGNLLTPEQLLVRLDGNPEDFSPNALLRPVVQDYLLPTVAYIGGPAELAYLAQAEVLYRRVLGRMPVAAPRAGFTILDARAEKLMKRYGLDLGDVLHGPAALEQRIALTLAPPELQAAFHAATQEVESALDGLGAKLSAFDPTLAAALENSRRKIRYQLAKIQGKAAREAMRRTERARSDAAYLINLILPEKTLQERLYSVLPFLARHGLGLLDDIAKAIQFGCPDHQILSV
ncbi:MAG TPA: bacillithiol biosynthesis cysteine-adding enzyme BshC [Bryobacterales bacterium]|jgi:bacillithiol biosynthesis cysteine-adding enzyme BshC|nr:bacillithiol biosynthesis cysteine-adding enzyme BshC [Bryobacterales bacterium]